MCASSAARSHHRSSGTQPSAVVVLRNSSYCSQPSSLRTFAAVSLKRRAKGTHDARTLPQQRSVW